MNKTSSSPRRAKPHRRATPHWRARFMVALAETSNVARAARAAKIDPSTVYKLRRSDMQFARDWQSALAEGYDNLEMDLLLRLRTGELDGSSKAKARRKFDNGAALRLLVAHRAAVSRAKAIRADEDEDTILASIDEKLERMRQREHAAKLLLGEDGSCQSEAADEQTKNVTRGDD